MARFSFRFIDDEWGDNNPDTEIIHKFNATKDVASLVKHFENFLKSSGVDINGTINYVPSLSALDEIKIELSEWNDFNLPGNTSIEIDPNSQFLHDSMLNNPSIYNDENQITILGNYEEPIHFRV